MLVIEILLVRGTVRNICSFTVKEMWGVFMGEKSGPLLKEYRKIEKHFECNKIGLTPYFIRPLIFIILFLSVLNW